MTAAASDRYAGTLTTADLDHIARVRGQWMTVGLSVEDADPRLAHAAASAAYHAAGIPEPPLRIWMDSPLGGVYAATAMWQLFSGAGQRWDQLADQLGDHVGNQLGHQVLDQLRDQLEGQRWDQLRNQRWDQLGDQLGIQLQDELQTEFSYQLKKQLWEDPLRFRLERQIHDQLWDQLGHQLGHQLADQTRLQLRDQLGDQLQREFASQIESSLIPWWNAHSIGCRQCAVPIAPVPASPRLDTLAAAIQAAGWWIPLRGATIMASRPVLISRDSQGRLHSATGRALQYRDGWGFHAWHGRGVPEWVITAPGIDRIAAEPNIEIRRCAIESMGWDRFIADAQLTQVGSPVPDPGNPGQHLVLYDVPKRLWGSRIRLLMCTNGPAERDGTRRRYGLTTPADINDPITAAAWAARLSPDEYARMVRRT
jgi:hypothetical protein